MQVTYKTNKLEKVCENAKEAAKAYGEVMAEKIHQRIDEIKAAENVEEMIKHKIGRCHPLKGNRKGQYALDLEHPQRLIFVVKNKKIIIANIVEITDYH